MHVFFFRRECRVGAGTEQTPGVCDTPGFELIDEPTVATQRKAKKLLMPRNHPRVTQTSIDLIRSWRGNCDVQFLIYESPPGFIDVKEISRVTDYVVGYTCKGGTTLKEERETNKQLSLSMEQVTGDDEDLKRLAKKIMNKASTRRLISKQEACVLLAGLKLTSSSDLFNTISIAQNKRITTKDNKSSGSSFLSIYASRPVDHLGKNLADYFKIHREERRLPPAIPHFVGVNSTPTFPVTESYARHTLIVYKPWTVYPNKPNWKQEFDQFVNHHSCPKAARMAYDRVMQRHYNGTKFVDPISSKGDHANNDITSDDEEALVISGLANLPGGELDDSVFMNIDRGFDCKWDQPPLVGFVIPGLFLNFATLSQISKSYICFNCHFSL